MSRSNASHEPKFMGKVHPAQMMMELFLSRKDLTDRFAGAVVEIRQRFMKSPTCFDGAGMEAALREMGVWNELRDHLIAVMKLEPKKGQLMREHPKPPKAAQLYGRIEVDSEILDVGSGDGKRLIQFDGAFKMHTVDVTVEEVRCDSDHLKQEFVECTEMVITSFNSLTNNRDQKAFENSDGLHIVPKMDSMVKAGFSSLEGDLYKTVYQDVTYEDYKLCLPVAQHFGEYYAGVNTFQKRGFDFKFDGLPIQETGMKNGIEGNRIIRLGDYGEDVTWKLRGTQYILVMDEQGVYGIVDRRGVLRSGVAVGERFVPMRLVLQHCEGVFYLLKVHRYRGFEPYHSTAALRYFLERVDVRIDGITLSVPPSVEEDRPHYAEGIVYRHDGSDWLLRDWPGIDWPGEEYRSLIVVLEELCFVVGDESKGKSYGPGLREFEVHARGEGAHRVVELVDCGERFDKKRRDTADDVKRMMDWPYLGFGQGTGVWTDRSVVENDDDSDHTCGSNC